MAPTSFPGEGFDRTRIALHKGLPLLLAPLPKPCWISKSPILGRSHRRDNIHHSLGKDSTGQGLSKARYCRGDDFGRGWGTWISNLNTCIIGAAIDRHHLSMVNFETCNSEARALHKGLPGRIRPDKDCPRRDIVAAMTSAEDGGLGYPTRFWVLPQGMM
jgi:hypothetical protein